MRIDRWALVVVVLLLAAGCGDTGGESGGEDAGLTASGGGSGGNQNQTSDVVCSSCNADDDCGGAEDQCLRNRSTGEQFCATACDTNDDCPDGSTCAEIDGTSLCVPPDGSCRYDAGGTGSGGTSGGSSSCDPACGDGEVCSGGRCVPVKSWDEAQKHCVDVLNDLRARKDKPPLEQSSELEECATEAAVSDAQSGTPHGHFQETRGCGGVARAENEIPGWSLERYGSVKEIVKRGSERMFDEGPGGGHYENIVGDHQAVGCGIYVTDSNDVWLVQDFN